MRFFALLSHLPLTGVLAGCAAPAPEAALPQARGPMAIPGYTAEGKLLRPEGYESWVFAGASMGLGYSEGAKLDGPGVFHNVFLQPEAFEEYSRTGHFPEKTMFILALHEPRQRESIARQGWFEGELTALEAAVKDSERFKEGWAYFDFGKKGLDPTARAQAPESCHSCHLEHGADDNVFVQFYPPLRRIRAMR